MTATDVGTRSAPPVTALATGSTVVVRDTEWLVEQVAPADGGLRLTCRGLGELVRDSTATFFTSLDDVAVVDPADARLVLDDTPGLRRTRLWVEAVLRKTPVPLHDEVLATWARLRPGAVSVAQASRVYRAAGVAAHVAIGVC